MRTLFPTITMIASLLLATIAPASAQTVFRLGTGATPKHPNGVMAEAFKQEIERLSGGEISIQIFPNASLGGELELANQVRTGELDMCAVSTPVVATISAAVQLSELPFFYKDYDTARMVMDGEPGQMALATLEAQGVKGLAWGEIGFRGVLNSVKPVESAEQVKGMKIRVVENRLYVETWRVLGANPVPMSWPEVYTGLQQKTVDGVDTNYAGMIDAKHYEVAKHLALTNHSYTSNIIMIGLDKFNALSPAMQAMFIQAAKVGSAASREAAKSTDENAVRIMTENGVAITEPDRAPFQEALKPVIEDFSNRVGPEIVEKARALMAGR